MREKWQKGSIGKGGNELAGSNIRLMVPATQAASRRMMNSKPSLEIRVTYSDWGEGMMESESENFCEGDGV